MALGRGASTKRPFADARGGGLCGDGMPFAQESQGESLRIEGFGSVRRGPHDAPGISALSTKARIRKKVSPHFSRKELA